MIQLRKCPRCGRILPDSMFAPRTRHCKICRRDYDWQYKYGISPEQYYEMWEQQKGRCKICGKKLPEGQYLCVDHNAETGEIDDTLRISYINDKDFTPKVMKKIIKLIHEYQKDKIDD